MSNEARIATPLGLPGDPVYASQAVTKNYADTHFLGVGGGTLTGLLIYDGDQSASADREIPDVGNIQATIIANRHHGNFAGPYGHYDYYIGHGSDNANTNLYEVINGLSSNKMDKAGGVFAGLVSYNQDYNLSDWPTSNTIPSARMVAAYLASNGAYGPADPYTVLGNAGAATTTNVGFTTAPVVQNLTVRNQLLVHGFTTSNRILVTGTGSAITAISEPTTNDQYLRSDLTWATVSTGGTSFVSGVTANYLIKSSGAVGITQSILYDDGANIGIGTTNPVSLLEVYGTTAILTLTPSGYSGNYRTVLGAKADATGVLILGNNGTNEIRAGSYATGGELSFIVNNTAGISSAAAGTMAMKIDSSGNIGIKTATAYYTLDIYGSCGINNRLTIKEHIYPYQDLYSDLGATDKRFNNIYTNNLYAELITGVSIQNKATFEPTGVEDRSKSTLAASYATGTLTVTMTPAGTSSFNLWSVGTKITKTSLTWTISSALIDTDYFCIVTPAGITSYSVDAWEIERNSNIFCAIARVNGAGTVLLFDERHGIIMDAVTHDYLHDTMGARYGHGLAGTFNGGVPATAPTYSIATGAFYDEDIKHEFTSPITSTRFFYQLNGAQTYTGVVTEGIGYLKTNAGGNPASLAYNIYAGTNTSALVKAGNSKFVAYWYFISNGVYSPLFTVVGQREDNTLADAKANNTLSNLVLSGIPYKEYKLLYCVIYQANTGTGNVTWVETIDYRNVSNAPAGNYIASYHANLAGLTVDDHLQYALLAGRNSNNNSQTIYGGAGTTGLAGSLTIAGSACSTAGTYAVNIQPAAVTSLDGAINVFGTLYYKKLTTVGDILITGTNGEITGTASTGFATALHTHAIYAPLAGAAFTGIVTFNFAPFTTVDTLLISTTGGAITGIAKTSFSLVGHTHALTEITTTITANKLIKSTGTGLSDSLIYDNGTNVGIYTASPSAKLHVEGNCYIKSDVGVNTAVSSAYNFAVHCDKALASDWSVAWGAIFKTAANFGNYNGSVIPFTLDYPFMDLDGKSNSQTRWFTHFYMNDALASGINTATLSKLESVYIKTGSGYSMNLDQHITTNYGIHIELHAKSLESGHYYSVDNQYGIYINKGNYDYVSDASCGATNRYGLYVDFTTKGKAAYEYGVYIANSGLTSDNYGVYQTGANGRNVFYGSVEIGAPYASDYKLYVTGKSYFAQTSLFYSTVRFIGMSTTNTAQYIQATSDGTLQLGTPAGGSGILTNPTADQTISAKGLYLSHTTDAFLGIATASVGSYKLYVNGQSYFAQTANFASSVSINTSSITSGYELDIYGDTLTTKLAITTSAAAVNLTDYILDVYGNGRIAKLGIGSTGATYDLTNYILDILGSARVSTLGAGTFTADDGKMTVGAIQKFNRTGFTSTYVSGAGGTYSNTADYNKLTINDGPVGLSSSNGNFYAYLYRGSLGNLIGHSGQGTEDYDPNGGVNVISMWLIIEEYGNRPQSGESTNKVHALYAMKIPMMKYYHRYGNGTLDSDWLSEP